MKDITRPDIDCLEATQTDQIDPIGFIHQEWIEAL